MGSERENGMDGLQWCGDRRHVRPSRRDFLYVGLVGGLGLSLGNYFGMTGGVAYVYDEADVFQDRYNAQSVSPARLSSEEEILAVKEFVYRHLEKTDSEKAHRILGDWQAAQAKFWKITPSVPVAPTPPPEAAAKTPDDPTVPPVITEKVTATP